jgi:hypothetical protein
MGMAMPWRWRGRCFVRRLGQHHMQVAQCPMGPMHFVRPSRRAHDICLDQLQQLPGLNRAGRGELNWGKTSALTTFGLSPCLTGIYQKTGSHFPPCHTKLAIDVAGPLYDRCRDIMEAHCPSLGRSGELPPRSQSARRRTCIASALTSWMACTRIPPPGLRTQAKRQKKGLHAIFLFQFQSNSHLPPLSSPIPHLNLHPVTTLDLLPSRSNSLPETTTPFPTPSCWAPDQWRALRPGPPRWHDARDSPVAASSPRSPPAHHKPPAPAPTSRLASPAAWLARPSSTASTPSPPLGA